MKTKIKGFLTLFLALLVQVSFAQTKTVTGTVLDESGLPLLGAAVIVLNTTKGTSTDFDGKYSLEAANGDKIQVSYIGYETKTVTVGNNTTYNFSLERVGSELDAVVLVGYGSGRNISSITGSIATVSSDKLSNKPVANVMEALQGQVAGLQLFTSSGEPTALSTMRLHGVGSVTASNEPLYLLDGMPIPRATLLTLNSNDFETVTILKDAAATSIYGSRAANGVVYITSKKGQAGEAKINLSYEYGFSELARKGKLGLMNSDQLLDFQLNRFIGQATYDAHKANGYDTDWESYMYKDNAPMRKVDMSVSGGNDKTRYYFSGNYLDHQGVTIASGYERFTVRSNIDTKLNNWATMGVNLTGGTDERETYGYGANSTAGSLGIFLRQPYYNPYAEDGSVLDYITGVGSSNEYLMRMQPGTRRNQQVNGNFFLELKPMQGLTLRSQYGIDFSNSRTSRTVLPSAIDGALASSAGQRTEGNAQAFNHTITNTAEYRFSLDDNKHNFSVLAGQEGTEYDYDFFSVQARGMTDDRLIEFGAGTLDAMTTKPSMETAQYAYLSYFGQVNYDYLGKYFVDLSIRSDESSRFGSKNRKATFWAIGTMWNMTKEKFMQDVNWVNDLRVSASYGTTGNSEGIGNYGHLALVGAGGSYGTAPGWRITTAGNPELGWEEQSKLTVGFASSLFNNKLTLDVDYYLRKTDNMLMAVPQPYTSGFSSIYENVGAIQNQGIDVTLGTTLYQDQNWNVGFTKTFNYNQNKITELFYGLDEWVVANTGVAYLKGSEVTYFYPKWLGIDPADGMQMWEDPTTGEATKIFDEEGLEQQLKGKPRYAPIQGGFSLNASWSKGLSFSADFAYMLDNYLFNNDRFFSENPAMFGSYNQSADVLDEWKNPGDVTKFPKFGQQMQFDSRLIENASFLRLKNISIAYDIPKTLLGKNNPVQAMRFSLSARNLFTVTNYSGLDPEVDSNITLGQYPNTKQYVASVRVSF